ncbi:hypothetical protein [Agromyces sp. NPDC057865]|uniref:hypothetical protein n=1 Tax=Agromyces sp. NPDC057865 TaxID=3346267 RepID=UPI00366CD84C
MGHRTIGAMLAASVVLLLAACAGAADAVGSVTSIEAKDEWTPARASVPAAVTASGMVLEDSDGPRLCAGMIADSLPPQCTGPAIIGWDWDVVDGETTAAGTTWGEYRMEGMWDGDAFTLGRPAEQRAVTQETYEPNAPVPTRAPDPACESKATLPHLRDAVPDIVSVMFDLADECVTVHVLYDDGTLQASVDERFGTGALKIASTFTPAHD